MNNPVLFLGGAILNLLIAIVIVRYIYYPVTQDKQYVFTFLAFNTIIYAVMGLLTSIELSVGVGFGLFAIFSVLRYRTEEIPIREMTYLFVVIAMPVMNAVLMTQNKPIILIAANLFIVAVLYVLEKEWGFRFETSKKITYERIDLIIPAKHDQLMADLRQRTGLPITRVEIGRIDFLHDSAEIKIYFSVPIAERRTLSKPVEQSISVKRNIV